MIYITNITTDKILKGFKIIFLYDWHKYDKILGYYDKFRSVTKSENTQLTKRIFISLDNRYRMLCIGTMYILTVLTL